MDHQGAKTRTTRGLRRIALWWNAESELERIVATYRGRMLNKWKHYYPVYERHFAPFVGRDITLLEVGVGGGGSLDLWRAYFGPKAKIVGIDVNPKCKDYETPGTHVRIGDQGDPAFLASIAREFGPFDIVIEDGSHQFAHQIEAFRSLFGHVKPNGLYCCEDLCTSYWPDEFNGGVGKAGTGIEFFKRLVDEQNAWFWRDKNAGAEGPASPSNLYGIHFYPTLLVIEKRDVENPVTVPVGQRL